jgi:hypothetical protein
MKIFFFVLVQANKGFRGTVKDKESQKIMVNATIRIQGFKWTFHVNKEAKFHIYLPPGSYRVTISCHGYQSYKQVRFLLNSFELCNWFLFIVVCPVESVVT